jgi:lysophospholipid acyltransferase (LPLAT)-like uncharacterized protein
MRTIRGSSRRGGAQAVREMLAADARTVNLAITPDGPRGPRHVFQAGAVYVASRTGLPVYPATIAFRRACKLPTWDGFLLPCPFTRALLRLGAPVEVPPEIERESIEGWRGQLEDRLRRLTEETDRSFEELYRQAKRLGDVPQERLEAPPAAT